MINPARETIIIPDENRINIPIFKRKLEIYEGHGLGIEEFSDKYNLNSFYKEMNLTQDDYFDIGWFIETTKLGHLAIQKDEDIIIYLPPIITKQQYRYLLEMRNEFSKYKNNLYAHSLYYNNKTFSESGINTLMMNDPKKSIDILYQEIRKKYIPNTDSFILIIPDEEQLVIENGIYFKEFDTEIGHAAMLQIFCMTYLLPIKVPEITGNPWAKELANNGFFVVKREKEEIYLFIPKRLSFNQDKWLSENRNYISKFEELEALIYLEDGSCKEIFKAASYPIYKTNLELIDEIYEEVNNKQKILKRG